MRDQTKSDAKVVTLSREQLRADPRAAVAAARDATRVDVRDADGKVRAYIFPRMDALDPSE